LIEIFFALIFAQPPEAAPLVQLLPETVSWNLELNLRPVEGHVFNLKSPNRCGQGKLVQASEEALLCRFSSIGRQELEVFVCDKAKTFCKREISYIQVKWPQSFSQWWDYFFQ
jgi:hypothetical protein